MDSVELKSGLTDLKNRLVEIREGIFDVTGKEKRLKDIEADLSKEEVWSDLDLSQKISKEKTILEKSFYHCRFFFEETIIDLFRKVGSR